MGARYDIWSIYRWIHRRMDSKRKDREWSKKSKSLVRTKEGQGLKKLAVIVPLLLALLLTFVHYNGGQVVEIAKLKQFDLLQQTDEPVLSPDIGILTIDEEAIEKYGQWPWSREVLGDLVWNLREAGAGIIVLPILFPEEDSLGEMKTLYLP